MTASPLSASLAADAAPGDPFAAVLAAHGVRPRGRTAVAAAAAATVADAPTPPASGEVASPAAAAPAPASVAVQAPEAGVSAALDVPATVRKAGRKPGKKPGRKNLPAEEQRTHCLSVRLNPSELGLVNERRGKMPGGEWARRTLIEGPPPAVPDALNRKAWQELARAQGNLNQIAHRLNASGDAASATEVAAVMEEVRQFRAALLGAKPTKAARPRSPAPAV